MLLLCSIMWFKITVFSWPTSPWIYNQEKKNHTHTHGGINIVRCVYVCVYTIGLSQNLNKRNHLKILFPLEIKQHSQA